MRNLTAINDYSDFPQNVVSHDKSLEWLREVGKPTLPNIIKQRFCLAEIATDDHRGAVSLIITVADCGIRARNASQLGDLIIRGLGIGSLQLMNCQVLME